MSSFYSDSVVHSRLLEFLGGDSLDQATAIYITSADDFAYDPKELRTPDELSWYLDHGLDIARSLADSQYLLLHLDIEYVNFDSPGEAYRNPERAFSLQQPVVKMIESLLLSWGIRPLHIITGQGHHFAWKVHRDDEVVRQLRELNPAPELLDALLKRVPPLFQEKLTPDMQREFGGLALVMEYVAHQVKEKSAGLCELPVEITAVHVGAQKPQQRELISVDISEYGDPLHTRMIRMPFTNYLKRGLTRLLDQPENQVASLRAIPLHEIDYRGALQVRSDEAAVLDLAARACVRIPEQPQGTAKLLNAYLSSRLRRFHQYYYETTHDLPEQWPDTYRRYDMQDLAPCTRRILEQPNDLLLKPAGMQLVTRNLMAEGWHPRHVAGLIRSIFEDPSHGWGINWNNYDAATRADFYVRIFSGLYETGIDRLLDFNCVSTKEKGFCHHPPHPGKCLQEACEKLQTRQCQ